MDFEAPLIKKWSKMRHIFTKLDENYCFAYLVRQHSSDENASLQYTFKRNRQKFQSILL